jgi:isopentenyldiphosphate isomerase
MTSNPAENDEEILDLVDEANQVIGKVRRAEVHGNPALGHRAVHVFIVNHQGQYFLQKRSKLKRVQPGKWDTSVGGHLSTGETYEGAALKEMSEELGVVLMDSKDLKFSHEYAWKSAFETEYIRTFIHLYEGPFRLQKEEVEDGRFWTILELKQAAGQGVLTPNLELELGYLGLLSGTKEAK